MLRHAVDILLCCLAQGQGGPLGLQGQGTAAEKTWHVLSSLWWARFGQISTVKLKNLTYISSGENQEQENSRSAKGRKSLMNSHREKKGWELSFTVQGGEKSKEESEVYLLPELV